MHLSGRTLCAIGISLAYLFATGHAMGIELDQGSRTGANQSIAGEKGDQVLTEASPMVGSPDPPGTLQRSPPAQGESSGPQADVVDRFSLEKLGIRRLAVEGILGDSIGFHFSGWYRHIDRETEKLDFSVDATHTRTRYRGTTLPSLTDDLWKVTMSGDYHKHWTFDEGMIDLVSMNIGNTLILVKDANDPGFSESGIVDIPSLEGGARLKSGTFYDYVSVHVKPVIQGFNFQNLSSASQENLRSLEEKFLWGFQNDIDGRLTLGFWHVVRSGGDAWIFHAKFPFSFDLGETVRIVGYGLIEDFINYFTPPRDQVRSTIALSFRDKATGRMKLGIEGAYKTDGDLMGRLLLPLGWDLYLTPTIVVDANRGYKNNIIGVIGVEYYPKR